MPLDISGILVNVGIWPALLARTPISTGVKPRNLVKTSLPDWANASASRSLLNDFPNVVVKATGEGQSQFINTFQNQDTTTIDVGVPMRPTVDVILTLEKLYDAGVNPIESECRAAFIQVVPLLRSAGYRWVGGVTTRSTRRNLKDSAGKEFRTQITWTLTFDCRPKRSQLIA